MGYSAHSVFVDVEKGQRLPSESLVSAYEKCFELSDGSLLNLRRKALVERADLLTGALGRALDLPAGPTSGPPAEPPLGPPAGPSSARPATGSAPAPAAEPALSAPLPPPDPRAEARAAPKAEPESGPESEAVADWSERAGRFASAAVRLSSAAIDLVRPRRRAPSGDGSRE